MKKKLVTVHADLTPDRRLRATSGHGRALYVELMRNMATRSKPDGGALASVVERFVSSALGQARANGANPESIIQERLAHLTEMVGGYDFAQVIAAYWQGHNAGNEELKSSAVRWLRGEYSTKTDARAALGVRSIVDDANVYDHLKLMACFTRLAGYSGMLVVLDEMVNLYKMSNTRARNSNYEQILRILNDCLQGSAQSLGFLMAGTPEFLMDTRKGLYSYSALQTRLAQNTFAREGLVDFSGPVINLANLTPEDLFVLLAKIRHVFASGQKENYLIPNEGIQAFMQHCSTRIGDAYFRTPRNTIKEFVSLIAVLEQNPQVSWQDFLEKVEIAQEENPDLMPLDEDEVEDDKSITEPQTNGDDDDLATFKL